MVDDLWAHWIYEQMDENAGKLIEEAFVQAELFDFV